MKRKPGSIHTAAAIAALCCLPVLGLAQQPSPPQPSGKLAIDGHPGTVPVVKINGRTFVEVEALARLLEGTLGFKADQITLMIPARSSEANRGTEAKPKDAFSTDFLKAGIEAMTSIREWRIALLNGVQNNFLLTDQYLGSFRRTAESKVALASAAASNEPDRNGLALLNGEFSKMQKMGAAYIDLHTNLTYVTADALENDPLDQEILECARGLAALVTEGRYRDLGSCH